MSRSDEGCGCGCLLVAVLLCLFYNMPFSQALITAAIIVVVLEFFR